MLNLADEKLLSNALNRSDQGWVPQHEIISLLVRNRYTCIELLIEWVYFESLLGGSAEEVASIAEGSRVWLIFGKEDRCSLLVLLFLSLAIFSALRVDITIRHVLPAKGAYHLILLELTGVAIDKLCPFVHFVTRFSIEFFLVVIIFLFELL